MCEGASKQSQHPKNFTTLGPPPPFINSWIRHWYRYGSVIVAASPDLFHVAFCFLFFIKCSLILTLNLVLHCRQFHLVFVDYFQVTLRTLHSYAESSSILFIQILLPFGNFYVLAIGCTCCCI